ncbi:glycosyltransferase family 4 protein [Clostridium perfringens]|nr:glycosyltransferase family 4 protein [Clostridium perfringens]MDK0410522.1 glycosyltransferase family 4 protein [Clostridium perfringens]MDK0444774.1 glycosyltransferase family 4 protein [Clostridium perfringens]MDK0498510.1 glycosyltransferase family 4 protein [Clostridium perfringens]MDK0501430.1 glycosyltransferase family 4 protein [Clostridium perfringens]
MKIGFVSNIRAPYRTLQLKEYSKIKNTKLNVYYTYPNLDGRKWEVFKAENFNEINLNVIKKFGKYGYLNKGIYKLVKENDILLIGGYEQPTVILTALLCKLINKPYIIFFDGISTNRLEEKESKLKFIVKKLILMNANAIMANGIIGKKYFKNKFKIKEEKIYNQFLSIDNKSIKELDPYKQEIREYYRKKYEISNESKVILYSGRLIDIKNIDCIIRAISLLDDKNITLLITGDGILKNELVKLSNKLNVNIRITGFIKNQQELFKHYFISDLFILPSLDEAWGLVVNEAMNAGLPVIVSENCGCSLDLVIEGINGYKFNPLSEIELASKIKSIFTSDYKKMGLESKTIISKWNFKNSRKNIEKIIEKELKI